MKRGIALIGMVLVLCLVGILPGWAQGYSTEIAEAVEAVETLDLLRQGLASSLEGQSEPPTQETFRQVCKPVALQAQQLSREQGWQVRQVATRYRTPDHAPQSESDHLALSRFEEFPLEIGFWQRDTVGDRMGIHYFRRIDVQPVCLACHGEKTARPDFVKQNYSEDRAYGFEVGDLRGLYAVFIPDPQGS